MHPYRMNLSFINKPKYENINFQSDTDGSFVITRLSMNSIDQIDYDPKLVS